jgi:RimJ/RimL family protein N-acetyltransferase
MKTESAEKEKFRATWLYRLENKGTIVLRPAREEDAARITERLAHVVEDGMFLEEEEHTMNTAAEEVKAIRRMKEAGSMYTVAEIGDKIAGVAQLKRGTLEMSRHTANFRIWIAPKFQGYGIGTKLMQYTLQWARHHGLEKVCLDVFADNKRAISMYKKYGFVIEGHRKKQFILDGKYVDEIFMSRFM